MRDDIVEKMLDQGLVEIVGGGDPRVVGRQNFTAVRHLTQLTPDMALLDFGCGCGRLALPVLDFLGPEGRYVGVDIVPRLVTFCHEEIAGAYPQAGFYLSRDRNKLYDRFIDDSPITVPTIGELAELGAGSFDVIVAFSVFTHLSHAEAGANLKELAALLRPGGKLLLSCFLINESSRHYIDQGLSDIAFDRNDIADERDAYTIDDDGSLTAVGFREDKLLTLARAAGLEPFVTYHGGWCGRRRRHSFQDLLVLTDESRLPVDFDPRRYLRANPGLPFTRNASGLREATEHYLQHGYFECRPWT